MKNTLEDNNRASGTSGYLVIEETCRMFSKKTISEEEFLNSLDWIQNLIEDCEIEFEEIFSKENPDWEKLKREKIFYLEGMELYKKALSEIEKYTDDENEEHIKKGLAMVLKACKMLLGIKEEAKNKGINSSVLMEIYRGRLLGNKIYRDIHSMYEEDKERTSKEDMEAIKEKLKNLKSKSEILSVIPLFNILGKEKIEKLEKRIRLKKYEKGEVIFRQGEPAEELLIIKSGNIDIYREYDSKEEDTKILVTQGKGDIIGEMSILLSSPRTLSAKASCDGTEVYVISKGDFLYMLNRYPELGINLCKILCQRVKERGDRLMYLSNYLE